MQSHLHNKQVYGSLYHDKMRHTFNAMLWFYFDGALDTSDCTCLRLYVHSHQHTKWGSHNSGLIILDWIIFIWYCIEIIIPLNDFTNLLFWSRIYLPKCVVWGSCWVIQSKTQFSKIWWNKRCNLDFLSLLVYRLIAVIPDKRNVQIMR